MVRLLTAAQMGHVDVEVDSVIRRVTEFLGAIKVRVRGRAVVAGCSGGVDSTFLLHALAVLGAKPVVAHVDYGLRGSESDGDQDFVANLCRVFGFDFHLLDVGKAEFASRSGVSLQEAARDIRYEFFGRIAGEVDADLVAVGHTLDDQAESMLLHLLRGTGLEGLGGMQPLRMIEGSDGVHVVRPLLTSSRHEIESAAVEAGLTWRIDASNSSSAYDRGRLRTIVKPAIIDAFGTSKWLNVGRSANLAAEYIRDDFRNRVDELFESATNSESHLSEVVLRAQPPVWRRRLVLEAMRRWCPGAPVNGETIAEVDSLLDGQVGGRKTFRSHEVVRDRHGLLFRPSDVESQPPPPVRITPGSTVRFDGRQIHCYPLAEPPHEWASGSRNVVFLNRALIDKSLSVRRWRHGDRMRPLGLGGSRLVSDLLTDRKVAAPGRDRTLLVVADDDRAVGGDHIVWVVGVEIDERARLTGDADGAILLACTDDG